MVVMQVTRIAETRVDERAIDAMDLGYTTEGDTGQDLAEFAGRACYQSWGRPNPHTADNEGYLKHIIQVAHGSVMEHGSVTYYVTGVSRSLTHELVRHRHESYSQLSQRFVRVVRTEHSENTVPYVTPPLFADNARANAVLSAAWDYAVHAYEALIEEGNKIVGDNPDMAASSAAKAVREAARAVLPNMTPTAIVITGNHRGWRELLEKRGALAADAEIRRFAVAVFRDLRANDPNLYQDFCIMNTGEHEWLHICDGHVHAKSSNDSG